MKIRVSKKFNTVLLFFSFLSTSSGVFAQEHANNFCNFLLELDEGVEMGSVYDLKSIKFENLKMKHQKKVMAKIDLNSLVIIKVEMEFFQDRLGNICRFKKYEIETIQLRKDGDGIQIGLVYQRIPKDTKSKTQAVWGRSAKSSGIKIVRR